MRSGIPEVRVLPAQCRAINGGTLVEARNGWTIITIPQSGGYSALLPLSPGPPGIPLRVTLQVEQHEGRIGVSLVDDDLNLLHERAPTGPGPHTITLHAPDSRRVRALLVRNMANFPIPSHAWIGPPCLSHTAPALPQPPLRTAEIDLTLRRYIPATTGTEHDGHWHDTPRRLRVCDIALVLIDAWESHTCTGWMERAEANMRSVLAPMLAAIRPAGIRILHAAHDNPPHPLAAPQPGDIVLEGSQSADSLADLLASLGTRLLIYAGYNSNMCLLTRPIGLLHMQNRGVDLALVRDAAIAMETPETLAGGWMHTAMINFVETNLAPTLAAADLANACTTHQADPLRDDRAR